MKYTVTLPPLRTLARLASLTPPPPAGAGEPDDIAVVVAWEKGIGELVQEGETLARVRPGLREDSTGPPLPVPSPAFGVLTRRSALVGEAIEAGEPIAVLSGVPDAVFAADPAASPPAPPRPIYLPHGPEERIVPSPFDQALAYHFAESARTSPHVFTVAAADVTEAMRLIARVGRGETVAGEPQRLSLLPFVVHAAAAALRRFPALNAQFVAEGEIRRKGYIHIGLALRDGEQRPAVPIVRDADRRSVLALGREIAELEDRARAGSLRESDLRPGATFSLGQTGSAAGVLYQTPLLHQPQAAFLSIGEVVKIPAVHEETDGTERVVVRSVIYLCLAHDARLVGNYEAVTFLGEIVTGLADARFLFA